MSTRVDRILSEIARLPAEEQWELAKALPGIVRGATRHGLTVAALARADDVKERIRARLQAQGQPPFSVNDDLDAVRDERLDRPTPCQEQG